MQQTATDILLFAISSFFLSSLHWGCLCEIPVRFGNLNGEGKESSRVGKDDTRRILHDTVHFNPHLPYDISCATIPM